ncbi:MAG: GSU2403 family nucleotidyltransferase fold protein [Hyphomicrobiaceae bacterium]
MILRATLWRDLYADAEQVVLGNDPDGIDSVAAGSCQRWRHEHGSRQLERRSHQAGRYAHCEKLSRRSEVVASCIDPRVFALHKFWMSKQPDREPLKRRRDTAQARAVAMVAKDYLDMTFSAKGLEALPIDMVRCAKELTAKPNNRSSR